MRVKFLDMEYNNYGKSQTVPNLLSNNRLKKVWDPESGVIDEVTI